MKNWDYNEADVDVFNDLGNSIIIELSDVYPEGKEIEKNTKKRLKVRFNIGNITERRLDKLTCDVFKPPFSDGEIICIKIEGNHFMGVISWTNYTIKPFKSCTHSYDIYSDSIIIEKI